jgi:hypothetical protein
MGYKKYTDEDRIKAMELLALGQTLSDVHRTLNIPISTIKNWNDEKTNIAKEIKKELDSDKLASLRKQKKQEFVKAGWDIINLAQKLLSDKLKADEKLPVEERKIKPTELTNILGVQYDKQALANNESTVNESIKIELCGELKDFAK